MAEPQKKKTPKGGRKGGALFPKIDLARAEEYAKRLVSKTYTAAQPATIILPGVFDSSKGQGQIRASALKQYNLLEGDLKAYQASELAKQLASSPLEEITPFRQQACLAPKVFKILFDTFQGDTISRAKIRQQAINLKVHLDTADSCVEVFVSSLEHAGLAKADQDNVVFVKSPAEAPQAAPGTTPEAGAAEAETATTETPAGKEEILQPGGAADLPKPPRTTGAIQVNISVDPSMDPEKLEKLLKLLKQYGAL